MRIGHGIGVGGGVGQLVAFDIRAPAAIILGNAGKLRACRFPLLAEVGLSGIARPGIEGCIQQTNAPGKAAVLPGNVVKLQLNALNGGFPGIRRHQGSDGLPGLKNGPRRILYKAHFPELGHLLIRVLGDEGREDQV